MVWGQSWSLYAYIYLTEIYCFKNTGTRFWHKKLSNSSHLRKNTRSVFKSEKWQIHAWIQKDPVCVSCSLPTRFKKLVLPLCREGELVIRFTAVFCQWQMSPGRINMILRFVHPYSFPITARKAVKLKRVFCWEVWSLFTEMMGKSKFGD